MVKRDVMYVGGTMLDAPPVMLDAHCSMRYVNQLRSKGYALRKPIRTIKGYALRRPIIMGSSSAPAIPKKKGIIHIFMCVRICVYDI